MAGLTKILYNCLVAMWIWIANAMTILVLNLVPKNESWKTVIGIFLIIAGAFLSLGEAVAGPVDLHLMIFFVPIVVGIYLFRKGLAEENEAKVSEKQ